VPRRSDPAGTPETRVIVNLEEFRPLYSIYVPAFRSWPSSSLALQWRIAARTRARNSQG
jgi:hypothetical protein